MFKLEIPPMEFFNDVTQEFIETTGTTLELEHSLLSLSKWEAKWHKPFLSEEKTTEEVIDYVKCMTLNDVDPRVYNFITNDLYALINAYISDSHTATTISNLGHKPASREIVTSEVIYYWMTALNVPKACEEWHLNRLLTMIQVCNAKNSPPKKMSKQELLAQRRMLNAQRKQAAGTTG